MAGRRAGVWVAVDPGTVRTGVAACDPSETLASPVTTLTASEAISGVAQIVTERGAIGVIVGLPLSLSGAEGTSARSARSYAQNLAGALEVPVFLVDERLTTVSAGAALAAGGHDGRSARKVVDQAAAAALLQGVLDARAARGHECGDVLDGGLGQRVDPEEGSRRMTLPTAAPEASSHAGYGRRRRRPHPGLVVAVLLVLLVGGAYVGIRLIGTYGGADDYPGPGHGEVVVEVASGDTSSAIGATLADADVVASSQAFVDAALADDRALGIQPGFYAMQLQMSAQGALDRLLDPDARVQTDVTIPEGLRLDDTITRLSDASGLPRRDFESALDRPRRLGLPSYAEGSAEGFLFPATYSFDPGTSADQMLKTMVDRYQQAADDVGLVDGAAAAGYTPREALTVASLVQAEVAERDFGKASRVVGNRLALGMTLGFDSTINYALGTDDLTLVNDQLAVDSPYNTYVNAGLPPGPINSPGEAAMKAAILPPEGDWLYFVAVSPDSDETRFTADYQQFLQYKDQFKSQVP